MGCTVRSLKRFLVCLKTPKSYLDVASYIKLSIWLRGSITECEVEDYRVECIQ